MKHSGIMKWCFLAFNRFAYVRKFITYKGTLIIHAVCPMVSIDSSLCFLHIRRLALRLVTGCEGALNMTLHGQNKLTYPVDIPGIFVSFTLISE